MDSTIPSNHKSVVLIFVSVGHRIMSESGRLFMLDSSRLLLLQRGSSSRYANKWCVPGGKIEPGETPAEAAARELLEETGISTTFTLDGFTCFRLNLTTTPVVRIESGFQGYGWFTPEDYADLDTMPPL